MFSIKNSFCLDSKEMGFSFKGFTIFIFLTFLSANLMAAEAEHESKISKSASGLPLPRFASLRSDEANMRTGPGTRYPIEWVFKAKGMPLEITAEYDVWRRVRDWEGAEGWMHKAVLSGKRTGLVTGSMRKLKQKENDQSPTMAYLEPGTIGEIIKCSTEWCKLKFGGIKGYLRKEEFWGTYADEKID